MPQQNKILRQDIEKKIIEVIKTVPVLTKKTEITLNTDLRLNLDLSSFDIAEICAELERIYNIDINFSTCDVDTVQQLCDKIDLAIEEKNKIQTTNKLDNTQISQKICVLIKDYCENNPDEGLSHQIKEPIDLKAKLRKRPLKLDNTDIMQLAMKIEKEFCIDIPQPHIDNFVTVEDIVRTVSFFVFKKEMNKIKAHQKQR